MEQILHFAISNWYLVAAFIIILALILRLEFSDTVNGIPVIDSEKAVQMMNHDDALVIDLRDNNAYANGHIINAKHVLPNDVDATKPPLKKHKKDKPIIFVDAMGQQAPKIASSLLAAEFTALYALKGGMQAWTQAEMPVVK